MRRGGSTPRVSNCLAVSICIPRAPDRQRNAQRICARWKKKEHGTMLLRFARFAIHIPATHGCCNFEISQCARENSTCILYNIRLPLLAPRVEIFALSRRAYLSARYSAETYSSNLSPRSTDVLISYENTKLMLRSLT